jgi:hypothetical protein
VTIRSKAQSLTPNLINRGCAHCGRGGSPHVGDGGFETRVRSVRFINCTQRAYFRHPNEAFFYDLDGTLTGTGLNENYTKGGTFRGASLVPTGPLLPPSACSPSPLATGKGTGGSLCKGLIFRRVWFLPDLPSIWTGKAVCVRAPWAPVRANCQELTPNCTCLPYMDMTFGGQGSIFMGAEGYRYNLQVNFFPAQNI